MGLGNGTLPYGLKINLSQNLPYHYLPHKLPQSHPYSLIHIKIVMFFRGIRMDKQRLISTIFIIIIKHHHLGYP